LANRSPMPSHLGVMSDGITDVYFGWLFFYFYPMPSCLQV
jgi:hypothetical protein